MAPNKSRSTSPINPPPWLVELLKDTANLKADIQQQNSAIRELRSISLENQQILRTRLQSTIDDLVQTIHNVSRHRAPSLESVNTMDGFRRGISRNTSGINKMKIRAANQDVRNQAVAIPRPAISQINRICWYHRQFGVTSENCIQPCTFVPVVLPEKTHTQTMAVKHRINVKPMEVKPAISKQQEREKKPSTQAEDWNTEAELDIEYPQLSASSSSSSDTDSDNGDQEGPNFKGSNVATSVGS